jgi:hypothetical protein
MQRAPDWYTDGRRDGVLPETASESRDGALRRVSAWLSAVPRADSVRRRVRRIRPCRPARAAASTSRRTCLPVACPRLARPASGFGDLRTSAYLTSKRSHSCDPAGSVRLAPAQTFSMRSLDLCPASPRAEHGPARDQVSSARVVTCAPGSPARPAWSILPRAIVRVVRPWPRPAEVLLQGGERRDRAVAGQV